MRNLLYVLLTFSLAIGAVGKAYCGGKKKKSSGLVISVVSLQKKAGTVRVALFKTAEDFEQNTPVKSLRTRVKGQKVVARFPGLEKGGYAVKVFHDANDNGEFDKGFLGIPKEGFGFSNDAMGTFGPPSFKSCHFDLACDQRSITINLKYL